MKTTKLLFVTGMLLLLICSCEKVELGEGFLEKPPSVDVTADTIFKSLELSKRYLNGGYETLPYGLNLNWSEKGNKMGMDILESLTDLCQSYLAWGGTNQLYYSGQYSAATENDNSATAYSYTREDSWKGIRIGWNFIEHADLIQDASPTVIKRLKAEAKVIIALHYTDMYRHYGGLPWVNHAYKPSEDTQLPRLTAKATMDSIVDLLDRAAPDLPWKLDDPANDEGRFTQASALGLKARLLLFGASPLFNDDQPYLDGEASADKYTWVGKYDSNLWNRAAEAAKDLLNKVEAQGGYALVNTGSPRKDFKTAYYDRGSTETLISTRVRYRAPGFWDASYYFFQSAGAYGIADPTKEYVDMFPMADGTPIHAQGSGWDPNHPWKNRDPRLYETILVNGDDYQGRKAELWIGGRERLNPNDAASITGFKLRKFLLDADWSTSLGSVVQWSYLRLSEIYLSYAEAENEANSGPTPEAYAAVNKVRNRVGLDNLPFGMSQVEFRKAVLRERALELGFEEVRWYDIVRWKRDDIFKEKLHGVNTFKEEDGSFRYETFELPGRYWQDSFSPKWYLSAFPPNEVNKGYGLVQNPGW